MRIAVIGAGEIGASFARRLVAVGHTVVLANSRDPDTLAGLVAELGANAHAATLAAAPAGADLVVLAIPFGRIGSLDPSPFEGRVVLDPMNYDPFRDPPDPRIVSGRTTSGQLLAAHLAGANVVKAFNTLWFRRLLDEGRADAPIEERIAIPIAGDDAHAKDVVSLVVTELGFAPVDAGVLADSWRQEYGQPVFNQPVGAAAARALLDDAERPGVADERVDPQGNLR